MEAGRGRVQEVKRAHGLLVALLLSLLLGTGPAAAAETGLPRVERPGAGKATLTVRSLKRTSETPDDPDGPLLRPEEPRILSLGLDSWPAGTLPAGAETFHAGRRPAPYHARAPPASFVV